MWAKSDTRIKVIHKQNGGVSEARNTGIKAASGEWIGFVDSDDYIHPEMFKTLIAEACVSEDVDCVSCNYVNVVNEKESPRYFNDWYVKEKRSITGVTVQF